MESSNLIEKLHDELTSKVKQSSEIYIAVGLLKNVDIIKAAKQNAVKIVTGTYLPTPPDVLEELRRLYKSNARIYVHSDEKNDPHQKIVFHPKVYLFKIKDKFVGYVSSANLTQGGLSGNIELSYRITNQADCRELLGWFNKIFDSAQVITSSLIADYRPYFEKWNKQGIAQKKDFLNVHKKEGEFSLNRKKLIKYLKEWRVSSDYNSICKDRQQAIKNLKKALDYDNGFKNIDLDAFLAIHEMGHIIPIHKNDLQKSITNSSLRRLCQMLCDDNLSITQKYEYAATKYKVPGCGKNIITKILAVHNPKEYFVWNKAIDDALKHFAFTSTRNKPWDKYELFCSFFKSIYKEVGIKDFAVLDYGLSKIVWE